MVALRLSEADHELVTAAVRQAELASDGEIVTIVADQSDHYADTPLMGAALVAALALATVAAMPGWFENRLVWLAGGWDHAFSTGELLAALLGLLVVKFVVAWAILRWSPLRLLLTPPAIKRARVHSRAIRLFRLGAERRTTGRTGILIYLSRAEHRAEILADTAIAEKVAPEVWGDALAALITGVRAGRPGEGMADAVAHVGKVLAEHLPKTPGDPNQIPDRLIEL